MASADGLILPKPAIPKTLGILNVIFAVVLILVGSCLGFFTLISSQAQRFGQGVIAQAQAREAAKKAADLKTLDDREKAATTDEEKAGIAQERDTIRKRPTVTMTNLTPAVDVMKNPMVLGVMVTSVVTGLILHVLLLVAGIGLIRLTAWGRSLTLWWAGLQIGQLLILGTINFTLIMPIQQSAAAANLVELKKQMAGPNAPPNAAFVIQMAEITVSLTVIGNVVSLLLGLTYPILSLILLRTAGARAACLDRPVRPDLPPDF